MMDKVKKMMTRRNFEFLHETNLGFVWKKAEDVCLVFSQIFDSIQLNNVKTIKEELKKLKIKHCIVLYKIIITSVVKNLAADEFDIEMFNINDLQVDILNHVFQPSFFKIDYPEIVTRQFLYQMPQFLSTDPIVKYYNYKKGDVIGICEEKCGQKYGTDGFCCKKTRFRIVV